MKKLLLIAMIIAPFVLNAQAVSSGNTTGTVQDYGKLIDLSKILAHYSDEDSRYSFFEVGEDMFKAFCELKDADSASITLFKKIKSVRMLELHRTAEEQAEIDAADPDLMVVDPSFYTEITGALDLSGYNQLLKSRNNHTIALFLKKEFGPADNEFLLITDRMVIDIRGDIMIKTIYQMEEMMGYVQQILPN